jgi:hypothetical protein
MPQFQHKARSCYPAMCSPGSLRFRCPLSSAYIEIQITLITTSRPLFSPPSYLKLHMPSVFSFQYAPVALCMPLLPTWGFPSVPMASVFTSLVDTLPSLSVEGMEDSRVALDLLSVEVGTRCCMMVLLTAYL